MQPASPTPFTEEFRMLKADDTVPIEFDPRGEFVAWLKKAEREEDS
jgi:hypothetical protein